MFAKDGIFNGMIEFFAGPGSKMLLIMGDSKDPKYVAEAIKKRIAELKKEGISKADFERTRRAHYGLAVMDFNNVDGLANMLVVSKFENASIYDDLEVYRTLTLSDVDEYLNTIDEENMALSVILPKE